MSIGWQHLKATRPKRGKVAARKGLERHRNKTFGNVKIVSGFAVAAG
jgi:hypothetical protein